MNETMSENMESGESDLQVFSDLHHRNVGMALKLQILWFFQPHDSPTHLMPFLSRNLLYVRHARGRWGQRNKKKRTRRVNVALQKVDNTPNLLFDLFKHETVMPNGALLDNPLPGSRKRAKANGTSGCPVVDVETSQINKRKRGGSTDSPLGVDLLPSADQNSVSPSNGEENVVANGFHTSSVGSNNGTQRKVLETNDQATFAPDNVLSSETRPLVGDGSGVYLSSLAKAQTPMFIHYLSLAKNGLPIVQVEQRQDRRCPFCHLDAVSDTSITLHLITCQGDVYDFKSARSELGQLHITATFHPKDQLLEGDCHLKPFTSVAPAKMILSTVPFVQCSTRKVASLDMATRKKSIRLLEELGAEENAIKSFLPDDKIPIRQYYHSKTCQPMVGGDWDVDSDDDSTTDQWLEKHSSSLLDDFTDLDSNEKKFMKLWNGWAHSHTLVADQSVPARCIAFVEENAVKLKAENLREELVLHLHNLWDNGVVSSDDVVECMMKYDSTGDWV